MTDTRDADLAFDEGVLANLAGDRERANEAFQRVLAIKRDHYGAQLNLLENYTLAGRVDEAEAMVVPLLRDHDEDQGSHVSVARLRERQGRYDEALEQMRHRWVDTTPESNAYADYLRMLVGAQHWVEASIEAGHAFKTETLWLPYAQLARILCSVHFREAELLRKALADYDVDECGEDVDEWRETFTVSGAIEPIRTMLSGFTLADEPKLAALRARFDGGLALR